MANLLQTGAEWLAQQRDASMSETVTYQRGATSASVLATPGRTVTEQSNDEGVIRELRVFDWLITASRLAAFVEPKAGDTIERASGERFLVAAEGSEPPFRWCDGQRVTFRIHTKRVA